MMRIAMIALALLPCTQALALTTETLTGEVFSGPATGETASGSFTYDETLVTGLGIEAFDPTDGLTLDFTFLGTTFFETDDIDYDEYPQLVFEDGDIVALDFVVEDGDGIGTEINDPRLDGFAIFDLSPDPLNGSYFAVIDTFFLVPEPASLALVGLAASLLVGCTRRRV